MLLSDMALISTISLAEIHWEQKEMPYSRVLAHYPEDSGIHCSKISINNLMSKLITEKVTGQPECFYSQYITQKPAHSRFSFVVWRMIKSIKQVPKNHKCTDISQSKV